MVRTIKEVINGIKEQVSCLYLNVGDILNEDDNHYDPLSLFIECRNIKCGPKIGCEVYRGKECPYKSSYDDKFLDSKQDGFVPF